MSETRAPDSKATLAAPTDQQPPTHPPAARVEREFTIKERAQWQLILRRFLHHRLAVVSLGIFIFIIVLSYAGAAIWKYKYNTITPDNSQTPSFAHPFGTDSLGHDMFARVLRGSQQSLLVAVIVLVLSTGIGAPWGAIAGFYGGRVDTIMMRFCDVLLTLPLLAVAGAINSDIGGSPVVVGLVLGGLGWVVNARVVRGVVLSLREQEFVEAARALGASDLRIVFRHLLPNVTGAIIVQATLDVATAILAEAALSFLGLGVQPPDTSLGLLTNEARNAVDTRPWLTINFIGDGLRDAFDPRQTRQRR
jgi:ABC-type dipeptide/oligopeptide/nickel transport system permease subunit